MRLRQRSLLLFNALLLLLCSIPAYARPTRIRHHWRPLLVNLPASQAMQNSEIDRLQLPRIVDDMQLQELVYNGELVNFQSENIRTTVAPSRRYAKPWTARFLQSMAEDFRQAFGTPLYVSSAVRTEEQQTRLRRVNRYAAVRSSHCAGITFDLGKHSLTRRQYRWIANYLLSFRSLGLIVAQEEPYCFHVAVLERYNEFQDHEFQTAAL